LSESAEKLSRNLFLAALFISPVIFFTDLTRNPYLIQERILQILLAISVFAAVIKSVKNREFILHSTFLDRPFWAFFCFAILTACVSLVRYPDFKWSIYSYSGRSFLMFIFSGIVPFYFISGNAGDSKFIKKAEYAVIGAGTAAALYAIFQFLNLDFIWSRNIDPYGKRSISTFGNPNFLSAYLMIIIFWIINRVFSEKNRKLWIILLIINVFGLAITMTRSSILGLLTGLLLLVYLMFKNLRYMLKQYKKHLYAVIATVLAGGILLSAVSPQFSKRIKSSLSIRKMGSALDQRLLIWESSYNMFKDTPIVGRGWGNFEIFYPFYQGQIVEKERYRKLRTHANNSHNFIFELLAQSGILGAGLYFLIIAVFVSYSVKIYKKVEKKKKLKILILSVAGIAFWIDNILNVSLFFPMPALAFWANLGFLAAEGRRAYNFPKKKIKIRFPAVTMGISAIALTGVIYFNVVYFISAVHFFKGFKFSRRGMFLEAKNELLKCHEIYALNVDNNYELGNVYARIAKDDPANLEKSIWAYKEALKANPGYDEIYFNLGVMYMKKNNFKKAKEYLTQSVEINPLTADAWRSLGDAAGYEKNFEKAVHYYRKAAELNPADPSILNNYGYYIELTGNIKKAMKQYVKALKLDPSFKPARANIIRASSGFNKIKPVEKINRFFNETQKKVSAEKWKEALEAVEEILEADPANLKANLFKGNISFKLGRYQEAVESYRYILAIDPGNQTAVNNLKAIQKAVK